MSVPSSTSLRLVQCRQQQFNVDIVLGDYDALLALFMLRGLTPKFKGKCVDCTTPRWAIECGADLADLSPRSFLL